MNDLLLKYINGNVTDEEKVKITHWLDADPKNMQEYFALRKLNDISIWHSDIEINSNQKKMKFLIPFNSKWYWEVSKIAAVFVFAFFVARFVFPTHSFSRLSSRMQTIHVPAGQRAEIILADSTKVWLNAKTTFKFPSQFANKERNVELDGEGFFEVTHKMKKPFVVNTSKYDVKVLGTKFNLIAYSETEEFETSLLEGAVEIIKQGESSGMSLSPNKEAVLRDGKMIVSAIENPDHFLWREGIISFDNISFTELVHNLELYFDIIIEVKNTQKFNSRYSGKFRMKDGVEHILKVVQLKENFNYRIDEKTNKIIIE
ncbi:DUF4974 domain-containing protein [Maribellus comscasis]|uniref:DUF4974 domain-containing protein n=1 Tax=Maribellus comscasis TaxID=2681766 RepID=A0A6I6JXS7_9BACT|nr:FecR family protein [Maribellus comscasis]QGY47966.1 DUF4974 domain-containing protein [Maribellus comscasis]